MVRQNSDYKKFIKIKIGNNDFFYFYDKNGNFILKDILWNMTRGRNGFQSALFRLEWDRPRKQISNMAWMPGKSLFLLKPKTIKSH